jgi:hypothetical protein
MTDFTKLHPATALWWEQRDRCRACVHHTQLGQASKNGSRGERCAAVTISDMHAVPAYEQHPNLLKHAKRINHRGGATPKLRWMAYCIDARLEDAPCGPNAKLFKEKS